jgi:hypothetical protein
MANYVAISDTQLDPDAPLTSQLAYAGLRENLIATAEGATGAPMVFAGWAPYNGTVVGGANDGLIWSFADEGAVEEVDTVTEVGYDYRYVWYDLTGSTTFEFQGLQDENSAYGSYGSAFTTGGNSSGEMQINNPRFLRRAHIAKGFAATTSGAITEYGSALFNGNQTRITTLRLNMNGTETGGRVYLFKRLAYSTL